VLRAWILIVRPDGAALRRVAVAHGDGIVELAGRTAVVKDALSVGVDPRFNQRFLDIYARFAPSKMGVATFHPISWAPRSQGDLQNLPNVHSGWIRPADSKTMSKACRLAGRAYPPEAQDAEDTTPLLPWRPAILSPTEILRFLAGCSDATHHIHAGVELVTVFAGE
jgi:hypothetical protein